MIISPSDVSACSPSIEAGVPGTAMTRVRPRASWAATPVPHARISAIEPMPVSQRVMFSSRPCSVLPWGEGPSRPWRVTVSVFGQLLSTRSLIMFVASPALRAAACRPPKCHLRPCEPTAPFSTASALERNRASDRSQLHHRGPASPSPVQFCSSWRAGLHPARRPHRQPRLCRHRAGFADHRHDHLRNRRVRGHLRHGGRGCRDLRGGGSPLDHQREPGGCHARRSLDHLSRQEDLTMAWGSDTTATQLTSVTAEQFFDQVPTLNPRETAHVQLSVDFPGVPDRPRDRRGVHHAR